MNQKAKNYLNAHSHFSGEGTVLSLDIQDVEKYPSFSAQQWVSLGFHPWFHQSVKKEDFIHILDHLMKRADFKIVAIGEVGLDRFKGASFEDQMKMFEVAIEIAQEKGLPLVIHSVKSANDILTMLKNKKFQGKCLFHDFNGSIQLQEQIISSGHFIGVGQSLFKKSSKVFQNIKNIPLSSILLETDEMNLEIENVYEEFCKILDIEESEVIEQVRTNFYEFFELLEKIS